ncbi:MAG TPA: hypothetical protein VFR02_04650 [bacterium]|nr:hypothetical protein [bacterium]
MKACYLGVLFALWLAAAPLFAAATAPVKAKNLAPPAIDPVVQRQPILAKWTTLEGMRYYYDGVLLDNGKGLGLAQVLYPLNDGQATGLLRKSEDDESLGLGAVLGGSLLMGAGLLTSDYDQANRQVHVPVGSAIALIVGIVADFAGGLWLEESRTAKFAAVERYNQVVRGEAGPSVENWKAIPAADLSVAFAF